MATITPLHAPAIPRGPLSAIPPTIEWVGGADGRLRILDQTLLPLRVQTRELATAEDVYEAIRSLRVRGAPLIGVAAAYGLCLGTRPFRSLAPEAFQAKIQEIATYLRAARPTAVNLAWALERIGEAARADPPAGGDVWEAMLLAAHAMAVADAETCRRIGQVGAHLVRSGRAVLTHCNAGALATVAYGTALSLLYTAREQGRRFRVFADETRPLLQGSRLTAFELAEAGIDVTVLCEGAAAGLMQSGKIQLVVVGADRIAANGDTANKVGTYGLALAARRHEIPFYVAAPLSTFDRSIATGAEIPIEQRSPDEVRRFLGLPVAAATAHCYNPAFDVTPADLLTGIVTERGIAQPVTTEQITRLFDEHPGDGYRT